ncbi:hypothetical protein MASR1M8_27630 [Thermomonas brevis]
MAFLLVDSIRDRGLRSGNVQVADPRVPHVSATPRRNRRETAFARVGIPRPVAGADDPWA